MKTNLEIFAPFAKKSKFAERKIGSNCIIYTRVSSKEQEAGFSLETQKREIELFCSKSNLTILSYFGGVFESAKTDEREEFNRMLKFARNTKEKVSYIMVYSVDRFSRSGANAIYIADNLRKENIKILAVTQPSDTFTATGKMQQNMQFIFSEYDNDLRKEKTVAGLKEMLLNGYWCNMAPFGYDQITKRKRQNSELEVRQIIKVNEKGKLIRKAFYWKAEDQLSNVEILKKLKGLGLKISKQQLTKILANPFYCGIMTHNVLEGEVVMGRHEKLISEEIFLKANNIKSRNCTWKHNKDFSEVPLKNFLKCETCGSSFVGYLVKKKGLWYYKCNKQGCKCNRSAKSLNNLFIDKLKAFTIDEKYKAPVKELFIQYFNSEMEANKEKEAILKGQLTELDNKISALEERFAVGEIEKELYVKFNGKFKQERQEIKTELESLNFGNSNLEKRVDKYLSILVKPADIWASNDYRGKLELQKLIYPQGILYNRENNDYRTEKINPVISVMTGLSNKKNPFNKGTFGLNIQKSPLVPYGLDLSNFLDDFQAIRKLLNTPLYRKP